MARSPDQTFRKNVFYGDEYVPTYSPVTAMKQSECEHTNATEEDGNSDHTLIDSGHQERTTGSPAAQDDNDEEDQEPVDEDGFDQTSNETELLHSHVKIEDNNT